MKATETERKARRAALVPLRVTARLRCGVISDGLLPLDGILYFAAHRDVLDPRVASLSRALTISEDGRRVELPLKRIATGGTPDYYYAASCAQWPMSVAEGLDHWTKRVDSRYVDLLEPQRAKLPISGGAYRGYRMPVAYRHALAVTWYAVGEPTRIRELLCLVTHLGKKTAMGWGAVAEWTVEPYAEDWSVTGPDGRLMRPVPNPAGLLHGLRPPYWLPRNQTLCHLPGLTSARPEGPG